MTTCATITDGMIIWPVSGSMWPRGVLGAGVGIGDHTNFFLDNGCSVVIAYARKKKRAIQRERFTGQRGNGCAGSCASYFSTGQQCCRAALWRGQAEAAS